MKQSLSKIIVFFLIIYLYLFFNFLSLDNHFSVSFLDIGQGDAILIQTIDGKNILIDGGPDNSILLELSRKLGFWNRRIDLMILTHPHADHVTGLNQVLERYDVGKILYSGVVHTSPTYIAWLSLIKEKEVPLTILDKPQFIELAEDCRLEIIYPDKSLLHQDVDNLNNTSLVMKLDYQGFKFLLTGDIEGAIEKYLLETGVDLSADVLKVAHHGSDTSTSLDFLEAVKPSVAVIQVGADNNFNHPSVRVLKRLARAGIVVYRNDLDGGLSFFIEDNELSVKFR